MVRARLSFVRAIALGALVVDTIDAATYLLASRAVPLLARRPLVCGMIYGIGAYFFMNLIVIPLSKIGPQPFTTGPFVNGILIHALGIGIPIGLIAARTDNRNW